MVIEIVSSFLDIREAYDVNMKILPTYFVYTKSYTIHTQAFITESPSGKVNKIHFRKLSQKLLDSADTRNILAEYVLLSFRY